jgi:hypothetical protein
MVTQEILGKVEAMDEPTRLGFLSQLTATERAEIEKGIADNKARRGGANNLLDLLRRGSGGGGSGGEGGEGGGSSSEWSTITDTEVDAIFSDLQSETSISSYDDETLSGFDFDGFNPATVIKVLISRGKQKSLDRSVVLSDLSHMASIAHRKGSITEKNYNRLKPDGKVLYDALEARYSLKKGGSRGLATDVITIGRVGPAMSGRIFLLLHSGKIKPKKYTGACQSSTLPDVFQCDAVASNVPAALSGVAQQYILGLCEARSIDKTCSISPKTPKPKAKDVLESQKQYVFTSYSSQYPSEHDRLLNFKKVQWESLFDNTLACAGAYKKINDDFVIPTKSDFSASVNSL